MPESLTPLQTLYLDVMRCATGESNFHALARRTALALLNHDLQLRGFDRALLAHHCYAAGGWRN